VFCLVADALSFDVGVRTTLPGRCCIRRREFNVRSSSPCMCEPHSPSLLFACLRSFRRPAPLPVRSGLVSPVPRDDSGEGKDTSFARKSGITSAITLNKTAAGVLPGFCHTGRNPAGSLAFLCASTKILKLAICGSH
jgi:hypothetical protein